MAVSLRSLPTRVWPINKPLKNFDPSKICGTDDMHQLAKVLKTACADSMAPADRAIFQLGGYPLVLDNHRHRLAECRCS